jgi:hypothetical protein
MIKVHLLHYGVTLCGFGKGKLPGDWPPGHKWLGLNADRTKVTQKGGQMCEECVGAQRDKE